MLKFFPLLAAALLALPVPMLAQDAGAVLRIIGGRGSDCEDSGQDEAHHRDCVARVRGHS